MVRSYGVPIFRVNVVMILSWKLRCPKNNYCNDLITDAVAQRATLNIVSTQNIRSDRPKHTVKTQIRRRRMRRLIRVYTVCHLSSSFKTN